MISDNVLVAIIALTGGIITTYITVRFKGRVFKPPKDRIETIFDGYEALIKQQQTEIKRKSELVDRLEEQLDKMEELVENLRADLNNSQKQIEQLSNQLGSMKKDYRQSKTA